ncbi:hypothetical protein GALMADRAFT_136654 [Galerina marginata CBS 339.88]|uniref:WW domain-containing protein n=1 Tax=Galerina marginata (strain CBS 339.88) TaxID=685588 RepID=A0A067TAE2_GALM3|nr:hypothetical protein GALMADRAFT_136654 [Galerina marginata CBS 339.88]
MVTASQLPRLLAQIRLYLRQILKGGVHTKALTQLLRRLVFWWSFLRSRWKTWRKPPERIEKPPSSDAVDLGRGLEPHEELEERVIHPDPTHAAGHYTINSNGEVVSLDNVAPSLYPYSGTGIRDASRSSQNLHVSRSAHNLAITTRIASRSSQHIGGSEYANSMYSVSEADDPEQNDPITITVEPTSPKSPTPDRKYSASLPQFPHHHAEYSQHRSSSPIIRQPEVSSPREIEVASINIPTRPASASPIYLENPRITPVMPEASERYINRPRIRKRETVMTIQPLTITFENPVPDGWVKYLHPEGGRYFFHKDKRIYTDADLYNSRIFTQLCQDVDTLEHFTSANGITLPEDSDLVIELQHDEDGDLQATYYYAHHLSRSIFFLDTYEAENLSVWSEAPGATSKSHLRHEIEAQYWFFLQLFPHSLEITEDLACELRDVILFFIGDGMTSPSSTSPYNLDDLHKLLSLADKLQKNIGRESAGATALLARLMYMFVHSRFLNFYGETCARIERHYSVYGTPIVSRTWLVKSLSPLLFSAPDFHLQTLQKMWVDGLMHKAVWDMSVKKMSDEWQEFVLFATVMLNANVAFLAIQSVDSDSDNLPYRSPAQISSYLSVVASIGSIVLGLLLIRQNRTKSRESADEMQDFMSNRSHPRLGLETLAILYSLPYALLMWGMVSFLAAFCFMCFQHSNIQARAVVGPFCFVVAILIVWCVWTLWEVQPEPDPILPPPELDEKDDRFSHKSSEREVAQPTMLSRLLLSLPAFLIRRQSVDSQRTVV